MNLKKNLVLAIETAIDGGSVSILEGSTEIDFWVGTSEVSKSEDVLEGVFKLFDKNEVKAEQIELVAVSTEAGSLTGLKIGSATTKGLAKAFGCRLLEVSLWDALAKKITTQGFEAANVFLPGGKKGICRRDLRQGKFVSEVQFMSREQFQSDLKSFDSDSHNGQRLFAHRQFMQMFNAEQVSLIDLGKNLAYIIGSFASDNVQ